MLEKISPSAERALVQIRHISAFDEMLSAQLAKVYALMTNHRDPVVVHQFQGRAQQIIELRAAIANAKAV